MENYSAEYALLSTLERSWLCKLETDDFGNLIIKCTYFTSMAARNK